MCMQSIRGGFEHPEIHKGECLYGSLVASPLTKEQLLKALADAQSYDSNLDYLIQMDGYEDFPDGKEREAAEKSASELYSDEFLDALNKDMKPLYTAFCTTIFDSDTECMNYEGQFGHGLKLLDTVHDKPAALVGVRNIGGGGACGLTNWSQISTYIDIDGKVLSVLEYVLLGSDRDTVIGSRTLLDEIEDVSLDLVESYFPDLYKGFWDV